MSNAKLRAKALNHGCARLSRRLYAAMILLGGIALALSPAARAANTVTVNTVADEATAGDGLCSLREAITNANSASDTSGGDCAAGTRDDRIVFSVSGTITLETLSTLPSIANTLTIDGAGQRIAIDGAGNVQASGLLVVNDGATVVLDHLTIERGNNAPPDRRTAAPASRITGRRASATVPSPAISHV